MEPRKLKTIESFNNLIAPVTLGRYPDCLRNNTTPENPQRILRMLIKAKYSYELLIPEELEWLREDIEHLMTEDKYRTEIPSRDSWIYVTVRHGPEPEPDNAWHLDGASLRVELIPERNYIFTRGAPIKYATGTFEPPLFFDPLEHNLFDAIMDYGDLSKVQFAPENQWLLLNPNCFHAGTSLKYCWRTFVRVTFVDIEIRDARCTQNPLLRTEAYGRNPVASFRDNLKVFRRF